MDIYYLRGHFDDGHTYTLPKLYSTFVEADEAYKKINNIHNLEIIKVSLSIEDILFILLKDSVENSASPYTSGRVVKDRLGM